MKVIINGAAGKMGQASVAAIEGSPDITLLSTANRGDDLAALIAAHTPDVVVEFAGSDTVWHHLQLILEAGVRPVIGSSGLTPEQINAATKICEQNKIGGIIAPNFAIGAVMMMKLAAQCAEHFPDANIIETHHQNKLDAPSGTAIKTAEMIAANRTNKQSHKSTETTSGALGAMVDGVPVHAIRSHGVIANQIVQFGGPGETLCITHNTLNREAFMPGVLLSIRQAMQLKTLVYGLENVL